MSHYKPYPAYRDSGVEWIGQVPEHWGIARIKRHASIRTERRSDVPADATYIGLEDVEAEFGQYKPTSGNSRQTEDSTVGIFYEQDVLYGKLRPYLRKAIVAEMDGACSTEFLVLKTGNTLPRWLQQWLLTPDVTQQIEAGCEGAKMPRADWEHVGSIEMPAPSQEEQIQVVSAIDRETVRIDALITKKTRFIELLKEKRQALITHAVTKGLDPNVKMKDSGVEWIGDVPEHWVIHKVKHIFRLNCEKSESDHGKELLSVYAEIGVRPRSELEPRGNKATTTDGYWIVRKGDIVVNILLAWMGGIGYSDYNGVTSPAYDILTPEFGTDSRFFHHVFRSPFATTEFKRWSKGVMDMRLRLYWDSFGQINVAVPPLDEQQRIVGVIEKEWDRIESLVSKTQRSIDLLKERRAAFITAAVTGQIDLRESA